MNPRTREHSCSLSLFSPSSVRKLPPRFMKRSSTREGRYSCTGDTSESDCFLMILGGRHSEQSAFVSAGWVRAVYTQIVSPFQKQSFHQT